MKTIFRSTILKQYSKLIRVWMKSEGFLMRIDSVVDMGAGFVQRSRAEFEAILSAWLPIISRSSAFGIFGTADAAYYINEFLFRHGYEDVVYFSTNPQFPEIEGRSLRKIECDTVRDRDVIFTSSLSDSATQEDIIRHTGYSGTVLTLPDLKHLSVTMMQDSASNEQIMLLKNCHKNTPAFVIGNGASLLETDPRSIGIDAVTFAGNGIVRLEGFVPDYYFSLDYSALVHWSEEIFRLSSRKFFPSRLYEWVREEYAKDSTDNVFYPACYERKIDLDIDDWYEYGFETGHTIICPMLQMAAWMGCNPIYLIGVDLSHDVKGSYFTGHYHENIFAGYKNEQLTAFKSKLPRGILRSVEACRHKGVEVFNLAPTRNIQGVANLPFDDVI
ncbi:MAG: 6-hydroxymethylpterin diphosphokinase MptE-like protein [Gammaproteobacteria bacterium]|nr:6-hydroxymethylpterin diphosphokinase MptE-like protein [Gammaproteobacteria bacterium]